MNNRLPGIAVRGGLAFASTSMMIGVLGSMAACGSVAAPPAEEVGKVDGALNVPNWPALPFCTLLNRGAVYYVASSQAVVYCDGRGYQPLDFRGKDGQNGVSYVVAIAAATTAECPTGGVVIEAGPAADGGTVPNPIVASATVCNGAEGPAGEAGAPGANGATGPSGSNGSNGSNGLTSLVHQQPEPPGFNCSLGGTRIDSGLDLNGDGLLESYEIKDTSYVCAVREKCVAGNVKDFLPDLRTCTFQLYDSLETENLSGANLSGVGLAFVDLDSANLTGANLTGAYLNEAQLQNANLTNANLTNANLTSANLLYANFTGANLTGVTTDRGTICPNNSLGPCATFAR